MSMFVRQVQTQDWPRLRSIFLQARRVTYVWEEPEKFQLSDFDQQTKDEAIWVVQDTNDGVIGFVSIQQADYFIHHLYIDAAQQGKGAGKMLLQHLPQWGQQKYRLKCLDMNSKAAAFYQACGFVAAGTGVGTDGEYTVFEC